ncbi:hypothetical protein ABW21_db0208731 [Orbilia brochopaga]|nr:hypothetical protein ABW21_db0208731 [Drechslerella brochopaga]
MRIGDVWRNRYYSLVLHDPVWYDHLPYLPFPKTWPIFTPKDKMADWLEHYASAMELSVWTGTTITTSKYQKGIGRWQIEVERNGEVRYLMPLHVVLCTGHSGKPYWPEFENLDEFKGKVTHSADFSEPERLRGKKVVIIGAGNSAHDIAQSLFCNGAFPTMVQRSSTNVISSDLGLRTFLGSVYCEEGPEVEEADLLSFSLPNAILKALHIAGTTSLRGMDMDGPMHARLRQRGYQLDDGPDGAGLVFKYFEQGGSYYIDVGASSMIIDGRIGFRHGNVAQFTEKGVLLDTKEHLDADEIVVATGFGNMRTTAAKLFPCVEDVVEDVGGFDDEGEYKLLFKTSGHPAFWLMGMNLAHCRYYSRLLALKIASEIFSHEISEMR